jgi:protocatechuate 3,4-dioxygenase beta subunit
MRFAAILPGLALVTLALRAQTPAPKPGSVEGVVVNFITGEPIGKASVTLEVPPGTDVNAHAPLATMSDASGRFHFDSVEPGNYAVGAAHNAYMERQGRWSIPSLFRIAEGEHVADVVVKLVPLGVLSGHVLDEDGDPIPRAQVALLSYFYESGRKACRIAGQTQTNDLGEFEIIDLRPGRYYLQASRPNIRNLPVNTHWARREQAYPITFYPDAREFSEAASTDVAPGARVTGLDFHLRKVPAYHIRGKVAGQTASQQNNFDQLTVTTPGAHAGGIFQTGLQADGSFDIPGVASGDYEVSYTRFVIGKSDINYPAQSVHVNDADVNGLVFGGERPEAQLSGAITVEGAQPGTLNIYVALDPSKSVYAAGDMSASDGSFHIKSAPMELCYLDLRFPPDGYYVKSIRLGDQEIKHGQIDLTNGATAALNILLASDGGSLDGNVQTAEGKPSAGTEVTLAPPDEYDGRSDLFKRATTDTAGNFHIKDLAPGDYRVYAWETDLDQSPRSAEFRKLFEARSAAVSVGPKAKVSVQLTVITGDDISRGRSKLP